jgi:chromosomal replication initiator protein
MSTTEKINIQLIKNKFSEIKKNIEKKIKNTENFNNFIKPMDIYSIDNETLIITVKNKFIKNVVETNYLKIIADEINNTFNSLIKVSLIAEDDVKEKIKKENTDEIFSLNKTNIKENKNFDNFVVDEFNKEAFLALDSLTKNNVTSNFFFISGGVGLGKTHLLNAVGVEMFKINKNKKILYVDSDEFIREIYDSIINKNNQLESIKKKYENVDLFLFDDFQFLSKKTKIIEIFFSIFNHLMKNNKMIVITCNTSPNNLVGFDQYVISRLYLGLNLEIRKPSVENIYKILCKKLSEYNLNYTFQKEAMLYISRRCNEDIRKLEGLIFKISFYLNINHFSNNFVSLENVKQILQNENEENNEIYEINPNVVIENVCLTYGVELKMIKSKSRKKNISNARHVCMYIFRKRFDMPYEKIGKYFGNRNHSTVIESINKIESLILKDEKLKEYIEKIYKNL